MPRRRQFFSQAATALISCGLIRLKASAWTQSVAQQFRNHPAPFAKPNGASPSAENDDLLEQRAKWLINQFNGRGLGGPKFAASVALARLALNPDDDEVIAQISRLYDSLQKGQNGELFSYPGVAWVMTKYREKFTSEQISGLKQKIKGFTDLLGHGTENHALMRNAGAYLWAQFWPNEGGWLDYQGQSLSSHELKERAKGYLLSTMESLYDKGCSENLSSVYTPVHLYPYFALYECARDPEIRAAANAALHFHISNIAANHFEGVTIPPANRDYPEVTWNTDGTGVPISNLNLVHWLYWEDAQNWAPSRAEGEGFLFLVNAAVSNWRPHQATKTIARGITTPYELRAAATGFGSWGSGQPAECQRYVYRSRLWAMGSGVFQYDPDEFYVDYTNFRLIYKSQRRYNYIECYHPYWRSNDRRWRGINSPFMQIAQHKGTAIMLFNIPSRDPWTTRGRPNWKAMRDQHSNSLIQEILVRYPQAIDQKAERESWIFLREADVYIAIRTIGPYMVDSEYAQSDEFGPTPPGSFDVIRSGGTKNAVVVDVATKDEFSTFEAFQAAVIQNPLATDMKTVAVTYTSVMGDVISARWSPPNYDAKPRVLVRAEVTVNGNPVVMDRDLLRGEAVLKSKAVKLTNRVLELSTPAGNLNIDWSGRIPRFIDS